jgi:hypothetical protein
MAVDKIPRFRLDRAPAATGGRRTKAKQPRRRYATSDRHTDRLERLKREIEK